MQQVLTDLSCGFAAGSVGFLSGIGATLLFLIRTHRYDLVKRANDRTGAT